MSLTEMLVVTAVVAVLLAISVPAAKKVMESFDSSAGARALINAALSNARAMAMATGRYTGVRFQQDRNGNDYMIFIYNDPSIPSPAGNFQAVKGRKPMRLPSNVGVLDGFRVVRTYYSDGQLQSAVDEPLSDSLLQDTTANVVDGKNIHLADASTFSVVFSPSGHVVIHEVWVRNSQMMQDSGTTPPEDGIFNWKDVVDAGGAMFYQDDYGGSSKSRHPENRGIGAENSRKGFILYDKRQLQQTDPARRWSKYLGLLPPETVSPYTGELIKKFEGQF